MVGAWVFVWVLASGGMQFSDSYATQAACEAARSRVEAAHRSPEGLAVATTKPCWRVDG